ncbi:MAG: RsmD family RNA methyltransferase [Caldilineaceae bacterium]|nr:RsmD family RNA methyltransferase [Caldilineaceae bacterium]
MLTALATSIFSWYDIIQLSNLGLEKHEDWIKKRLKDGVTRVRIVDESGKTGPPGVVVSHFQAAQIQQARSAHEEAARVSPDLNRTTVAVALEAEGARFPAGELLAWEQLEVVLADHNGCFVLKCGALEKIQAFSEMTNRVYTLMPTEGAPTMLVSGIPMHRIKGTDPYRDTLNKLRAVGRIDGPVLDTCTGLGYTALEAARTATHVTTVELDPAVHTIIQLNPWSWRLFSTSNITPLIGDSSEVITSFPDASFQCIIHDPPMFSLAGDLYGLPFYRELRRVLRRGGRLFHYIGNPESKSGASVTKGVVRRLQEAGFRNVQPRREAFGVFAR